MWRFTGLFNNSYRIYSKSLGKRYVATTFPIFCQQQDIPKVAPSHLNTSPKENFNEPNVPKQQKKAVFPWKLWLACAGTGLSLFAFAYYYKERKLQEMEVFAVKQRPRSIGKPDIGGDFNLIDHNGKKCCLSDFRGKWLLLYFGFCHCPDICPEQIDKMINVTNRVDLNAETPNVIPIFVSIDPERDNPAAISLYIKDFSPKLLGLTGTLEQIRAVSKTYRVYYSKGPVDAFGDYIVDHAIIMYLLGPDGSFVDYYGQVKTEKDIANSIIAHMQKFGTNMTSLTNQLQDKHVDTAKIALKT